MEISSSSSPHYRRGAQFVLVIDMVYPWATLPMLNGHNLFEKGSALNTWWIGTVVCLDLSWAALSLLAFVLSCCCSKIPRRAELLLRAWFVSMSIGVLIHIFCTYMNSQWVILIFILILRIPYLYMVFLYWNDLKKLSKFSPPLLPPQQQQHQTNHNAGDKIVIHEDSKN